MKMSEIFGVAGNVALVTGAASGLGLAMAEVMADNGALVVMLDLNADGLGQSAERLRNAGLSVETAVVDVTDSARLREVIDATADKHGRLDAVFANAGMSAGPGYAMTPKGEISETPMQLWDQALKVNLTSVFVTIQAAAIHMKR